MTKLSVDEDGLLEVNGELIIFQYDSGDVDTFTWGKQINNIKLASALFDSREMGHLNDESEVVLPNGEIFNIESNLISNI